MCSLCVVFVVGVPRLCVWVCVYPHGLISRVFHSHLIFRTAFFFPGVCVIWCTHVCGQFPGVCVIWCTHVCGQLCTYFLVFCQCWDEHCTFVFFDFFFFFCKIFAYTFCCVFSVKSTTSHMQISFSFISMWVACR